MQKLNKQQLPSDVITDIVYDDNHTVSKVTADGSKEKVMDIISYEQQKEETSSIISSIGSPKSDNGDIPILELIRTAENDYQLRESSNFVAAPATGNTTSGTLDYSTAEFDDPDCARGYIFTSQAPFYRHKIFNKIKLMIVYPGLVRIGIVNKNILKADPKLSESLVKWLVVKFAAFTGLKEYDIEDTTVDEDQWIFLETRSSDNGAMNVPSGVTLKIGDKTYSNISTTGAAVASGYGNIENGRLFKTNEVYTTSARNSYTGTQRAKSSALPSGWLDIGKESTYEAGGYTEDDTKSKYSGGDLNIGLYVKGPASDTHPFPIGENAILGSSYYSNPNSTNWYGQSDQSLLVNKKVYGVKLDIYSPGSISIARVKIPAYKGGARPTENATEGIEIKEIYTHYFRSIGLNQWNFPKDIMLEDDDEFLIIGGYDCRNKPAGDDSESLTKVTGRWCYYNTEDNIDKTEDAIKYKQGWNGWLTIAQNLTTGEFSGISCNDGNCNLNVDWIVRGEVVSKLEGIMYSVQGDSISTFAGEVSTIEDGNTTNNAIYYPNNGSGLVNNKEATWWGILGRDKRMRLLRNDAWSGCRISETTNNANSEASASSTYRTSRLQNLTVPTTESRFDYGKPQLILSCLGTNDLSGGIPLGEKNMTTTFVTNTILGAFSKMCYRYKINYPNAKIVHFILPRGNTYFYTNGNGVTVQDLAKAMQDVAESYGQYFIPMSYFHKLTPSYTLMYKTNGVISPFNQVSSSVDYLHPSANGMEAVAQAVGEFLESIY